MENFTIAELGVFLGVLGGVMTSLILTMQKSKCETINCCGMNCKRKIKEPAPPPDDPVVPPAPQNPVNP